ncbi:GNAT family N-acetyltransferase [Sphingomonas radiodurans]|uniref:GNAT family N-acetyltransferase n=1 Tax=Sphingomonas radiodurans TaxID=2890321 RepID=UPI001E4C90D0|nr:GNAT family N-acetyltransferase [Sphingomonas radiodurans]WBH15364.1 GNAT family N-acetyltransferase [Sphingomonas radiodurans]
MGQPLQHGEISFRWDKSEAIARAAAAFAGAVIGSDTRYISHGEIQTGLSPDGKVWADGLPALYADDFLDLGEERDLLVALDPDGAIVGMVVLAWEESARRRFAVLEDMAVDPAQRSLGIGERLLATVEARVAERGIDWLFLESGLDNHGAHRFFERHGFATVSHVFAKRLHHAA